MHVTPLHRLTACRDALGVQPSCGLLGIVQVVLAYRVQSVNAGMHAVHGLQIPVDSTHTDGDEEPSHGMPAGTHGRRGAAVLALDWQIPALYGKKKASATAAVGSQAWPLDEHVWPKTIFETIAAAVSDCNETGSHAECKLGGCQHSVHHEFKHTYTGCSLHSYPS